MLFNSVVFFIFLPIVFILYWFVTKSRLKVQNALLLIASYVFYGWWDWRFLFLILFSTIVDYWIGGTLSKEGSVRHRKSLLAISLLVNLGLLGVFKYYNFFVESWIDAFATFGYKMHASTLNFILPVGISFYTFQTLSYSIDVYRNKLQPTKDFVAFAAFVSFFPQLVAGPIERASNLLPQILQKRTFSYRQAVNGLRLILWGLFKKIVVADSLAPIVDEIFNNYHSLPASTLVVGAIAFAFQIYGDFSGYSDIAIGTAKLFGIELMSNFKYPYFSRDIAEFWRRWHVSLSSWFRDYLYIPLGGSRGAKGKTIRNVFVIFLVSGFWHGANWTFVFWGGFHALLFVPLLLANKNRNHTQSVVAENRMLPSFKELLEMAFTFLLVTLAWVFFRAPSVSEAFSYLQNVFSSSLFVFPSHVKPLGYVVILLLFDWLHRVDDRAPFVVFSNKFIRFAVYYVIGCLTVYKYYDHMSTSFIYFQF